MYSAKSEKFKTEDGVDMRYNEELRQNIYRLPEYVDDVRNILKRFQNEGYFEN